MSDRSDYDRSATLARAFRLLALLRYCPRDLRSSSRELGVCERTVRRDLYTLERAGVPLVTGKIPNIAKNDDTDRMSTTWRLMPGASCPLCHASPSERKNRMSEKRPERIQRRRTKGWTMPEGAVYVGRPTKWGNPFVAYRDGHSNYDPHSVAPEIAVDCFRRLLTGERTWSSIPPSRWPKGKLPADWVSVEDVQRELRGKDLACWCPLSHPCHADTLLILANRAAPPHTATPG